MKFIKQFKSKYHHANAWLLLFLLAHPEASHAASIERILNNTIRYLQGPIAKSVGLAAIVISGYLCIAKQKLPKETFVMILVGMGIIFGGSSLYNTLIG
ncbi:TPA: TrbC/VirB2 family protein [Legionella pneumophila]|nr:TrbC/VirB2 family protein [Legionella pneumophila]HDS3863227.1 TrbC/VirB2 family protein [Legionella pneumophila]